MKIDLKPFANGLQTQVSVLDADLACYPWRSNQSARNNSPYVIRYWRVGGGKKAWEYLHRAVAARMGLDLTAGVVDHINGDTLDNRRENIRMATKGESVRNQSGVSKANKSGVPGVRWEENRWEAQIGFEGKWMRLGRFKTKEEAVEARLKAERELWGIQPRRAWQHD